MKKIIALLVLALLMGCTQTIVSNPQKDTITASGTYEMEIMPDKAEIYFAVTTNNTDAKAAQQANSLIANKIIESLKKYGKVETSGYNMYQTQDCQWTRDVSVCSKYYQVQNRVKLEVLDLQKVGDAIDAATAAGANNIDSLQFMLTKDLEKQVRSQAMSQAAQNAKEKAIVLANSLNIKLGKFVSVSESSYNAVLYRMDYAMSSKEMAGAAVAPTPIEPGKVNVQATVTVAYEI